MDGMTDERSLDWFLRLTTSEQIAFVMERAGPLTGDDLLQAASKKKAEEYLARRVGIRVPSASEQLRELQDKFGDIDEDEVYAALESSSADVQIKRKPRSAKSRHESASTRIA